MKRIKIIDVDCEIKRLETVLSHSKEQLQNLYDKLENGLIFYGKLGTDAELIEIFVKMGMDELSVAPEMILKLPKIVCEMYVSSRNEL